MFINISNMFDRLNAYPHHMQRWNRREGIYHTCVYRTQTFIYTFVVVALLKINIHFSPCHAHILILNRGSVTEVAWLVIAAFTQRTDLRCMKLGFCLIVGNVLINDSTRKSFDMPIMGFPESLSKNTRLVEYQQLGWWLTIDMKKIA